MAGRKHKIESFIKTLEHHKARLSGLNIGDPIPNGRVKTIVRLGGATPPKPLFDLYREIDGVAMMWNLEDEIGELGGGFNFQESLIAMLREGADSDSEPLEGVLWAGGEPPKQLALLKRMVIFESVPGRNDFMTFLIDDPEQIFLVRDGKPAKIHATLEQVIDLIIQYGGAASLREHLLHADWRKSLASDPELERIRSLFH